MPNLIDKPQLQATAQVAKSYILEQAISTADSLISAMSLTGGSSTPAPAGKTEGVITCDNNFVIVDGTTATVNVSYNGDGTLTGFTAPWALDQAGSQYAPITIDGGVATLNYRTNGNGDVFFVGAFYAQATDNYTAAVHVFYVRR